MPARTIRDGTLTIKDGTGTPLEVTVALEEGDLSWTARTPANIINDRGVIDHARKAPDEPMEVSFSCIFQSLSKHASTTPYDALTRTGGASAWVNVLADTDVWAVDLEFVIVDPGGGSETLTFSNFIPEEKSFQEGDPHNTISYSGRCVALAPAVS